jgi:hypothetical protein
VRRARHQPVGAGAGLRRGAGWAMIAAVSSDEEDRLVVEPIIPLGSERALRGRGYGAGARRGRARAGAVLAAPLIPTSRPSAGAHARAGGGARRGWPSVPIAIQPFGVLVATGVYGRGLAGDPAGASVGLSEPA